MSYLDQAEILMEDSLKENREKYGSDAYIVCANDMKWKIRDILFLLNFHHKEAYETIVKFLNKGEIK